MRRAAIFAAVTAAFAAPDAAAKSFLHGVAAVEATPTSAVLWTRFEAPGVRLRLEVARDTRFGRVVRRATIFGLSRDQDWTVRPRVPHLRPGTTYHYRFLAGRLRSPVGRFRTAPRAGARATVRFAITGDADATRASGANVPFFNTFGVYARMAAERNDFNLNIGDTIYSDSEVAGSPPALTVPRSGRSTA